MAAVTSPLQWAVAGRALGSGPLSGDCELVAPFGGGTLLAVIDGLGHGAEAAAASRLAAEVLGAHAGGQLGVLFVLCDAQLRKTRGAAISAASVLDGGELHWAGVGNVEAVLLRAAGGREWLPLRAGVVGYQLPPVRVKVLRALPGDTLVFATDGVAPSFAEALPLAQTPQQLADHLLHTHARPGDDALVLVARFAPGGER